MTVVIRPTKLSGCLILEVPRFSDERGIFVKLFHEEQYRKVQLCDHFAEVYYSVSKKGVLRGLHFQRPPAEHTKVVSCISGRVLDAVVDLRKDSPTYGAHETFELSGECNRLIYIPPGFAHGFYTLSDQATLVYQVSTVYSPDHDDGIRWDSAGIPWPDSLLSPILSERDSRFQTLTDFGERQ